MINFRGDFKVVGHILKDSCQRKNPEEKNSPRHLAHPCENFAGYAKISQGMRKFRRVCETLLK